MTEINVENYGNRAIIDSNLFTVRVNKRGLKILRSYGSYVNIEISNEELLMTFKADSVTENDISLFSNEVNQVKEIVKEIEKLKLRD